MCNSIITICDDICWIHLVVVVDNVDGAPSELPLDAVIRDRQSPHLLRLHWRSYCIRTSIGNVPQGHLDSQHLAEALCIHVTITMRRNCILGKVYTLTICTFVTSDDIKTSCPASNAQGIIVSGPMEYQLLIAVAHSLSQQLTSRSILPP